MVGRPRIGIVGNALLCFDPLMNDGLVDFVDRLGYDPVLSDPTKLYVDDVRYLDQLDEFADQGVDHVLYFLSFGCLKGHVHARAMNEVVSSWFLAEIPLVTVHPWVGVNSNYHLDHGIFWQDTRLQLSLKDYILREADITALRYIGWS